MEACGIRGHGVAILYGPDGEVLQSVEFSNKVTETGDKYYGERASGIASPPAQVTGMHLGTGTTAASKTGAGAAIVTYITGSNVAIDSTWPQSSLSVATRRIQWKTTWIAGVATNSAISEVVIVNVSIVTDAATTAANTISRATLSPAINKGAADALILFWNHDLLGA